MRAIAVVLAPVCLVLCMAAGEPASTAPEIEPPESQPVTADEVAVSVVMTHPTITTDQQPDFVIRFKNVGKEGYRNLYDAGAYWKWDIELTPMDPKVAGEPGPWRLDMNAIANRANLEHRQIKPGESTDVAVNLNDPAFTFTYRYAGIVKHLVAPVRHLAEGRYRLTVKVSLTPPFGPGNSEWSGPVTTSPVELTVTPAKPQAVTREEQAAYDAAIDKVTGKLGAGGLWMNGLTPRIDLPRDASAEDVIDMAVNNSSLSKAYRILSVKDFSQENMPGMVSGKAALLRVGKDYKVAVLFPTGERAWWSRFYDVEVASPETPATQPGR